MLELAVSSTVLATEDSGVLTVLFNLYCRDSKLKKSFRLS
jgi:hypothetical protein